MRYINLTSRTVTVRGVTFNPGDAHDVDGPINVPGFGRITGSLSRPGANRKHPKSNKLKSNKVTMTGGEK